MKRRIWITSLLLVVVLAPAALAAEAAHGEGNMTHKMTVLTLQLAAILIAAKVAGYFSKHYLRIPEVLGELAAGILIGPYLLGPALGLFTVPLGNAFPVSPELYGIATLASILLLYLAGLETDLAQFLKYSVAGSAVGIGGVVFAFVTGDVIAVWMGIAASYTSPSALFLGAISTATSVGITARILSEKSKLDSPEGVTILAGAVIDDVLGIIILAVVVGMSEVTASGGAVPWGRIGLIAAKAVGFWLGCTALGMLLARRIGKLLEWFGSPQTMATLSLGLALFLAGLSEKAGLALIIGAYITGLSLSRCDIAHELRHKLEPIYETLVSVFFVVLGMMVDLSAMKAALVFGLVYSLVAIVAKVVGCGLPALFTGFNMLGATRVGIGMLPRGEVALIVAGIGLSAGIVQSDVFGVAIMMTLITTLVAPLIMVKIFDDRRGLAKAAEVSERQRAPIVLSLPTEELANFLLERVTRTFEQEECYVYQLAPSKPFFQIRKDDVIIAVSREEKRLVIATEDRHRHFAQLVLMEALVALVDIFEGLKRLDTSGSIRKQILA